VKNHDFTPKNHIFPILGRVREIFGVFHVKNHDFTPKKIIFLPILGGGGRARGAPPPLNPPLHRYIKKMIFWRKIVIFHTKYPKNVRASLCSAQFF
jgi:hypothetical protein